MKKTEIIGMPMKYGCYVDGADLAFEYLKDSLERTFDVKCNNVVDTSFDNPIEYNTNNKLKYYDVVIELNKRLYDKVYKALNDNKFPLIIGGDHSIVMGSVGASLDYYEGDLTVIYIDKHADIHTEVTTPSGNMHGIPLSVCIGRSKDINISNYKLKPENLYYIGLSNYEIEEIDYINEAGIKAYMDFEVEELKVTNVLKEIINNVKTKYVHISFDLDSLKDSEFHAVNVSVENKYQDSFGLTLNMAKKILSTLIKNLNVVSMDIVEYNPLLDEDLKCKKKVEEILLEIKESRNSNDNSR